MLKYLPIKNLMAFFTYKTLIRSTTSTTLCLGIRIALQATLLVMSAKVLSTEEFSQFISATSLGIITGSITSLGLQLKILRRGSRSKTSIRKVYAYAIPATTLTGISISFAACLILTLSGFSTGFKALLLSETLFLPFLLLVSHSLLARGLAPSSQAITLFAPALKTFTLFILWVFEINLSLELIATAWVSINVICVILITQLERKHLPTLSEFRLPSKRELKSNFHNLSILFTSSCSTELDKPLAYTLLSPIDSGSFSICTRFIQTSVQPVTGLILTVISKLYAVRNHDQFIKSLISATAIYGVTATLLYVSAAPQITFYLFPSHPQASEAIKIFAIAIPALALKSLGINIIMAVDRAWARPKVEFVNTAILVAFLTLGAQTGGLEGITIAFVISEYVTLAVLWITLRRIKSRKKSKN